jgi:hypothetical protein
MTRDLVPDDRRAAFHRVAPDPSFCTERLDREEFRRYEQTPTYRKELHEAEREILDPLVADGFELVGRGIARCVLRFPESSPLAEHVVKLSRFGMSAASLGAVQNHREAMLWTRHGESGEWLLVPVADYERDRFAWFAVPYGEPISERPEAERESNLRQVRARMRFFPAFDMRELSESNVVLVDGTPLVADYGLPEGL